MDARSWSSSGSRSSASASTTSTRAPRRSSSRTSRTTPGTWATRAGRVGYIAKGVALVIVGFLFAAAGVHKQAKEASGLDGALKSLRDEPFGPALLVVMAIGFAAFGLYSFSRAKHAKV